MGFQLENFDFKVTNLENAQDIDNLLEEYNLQIKGYQVKLSNNEFKLEKTENRSDDLDEDIRELEAEIKAKETEQTSYAETDRKYTELDIALDAFRARLRSLNFRKTDKLSPALVVERNADMGEAQLLLQYYTEFKTALEQRKAEL